MTISRSNRVGLAVVALLAIGPLGTLAQAPDAPASKYKVMEKVALKARPFDLKDVRLLDSPFKTAMEIDQKWLLELQPDRFLAGFREQAGLKPKAEKYWGWESMGIAGHCPGHYITACALMYASTGDKRFLERVNAMVDGLDECQQAIGTGYVAAIPNGKRIFDEVAAGNIRSAGFDLNGGWVPWYTQHKVLAGLRDAYLYADSQRAKNVLIKLADWTCEEVKNLNEEQMQKMLACEQGGMTETLADVYTITGDTKYLDCALKFNHKAIIDPLMQREDKLNGKHANTQIPKIIGAAREYELTGDANLQTVASFFWDTVTKERSFVIGGNSTSEHFFAKEQLSKSLARDTAESCNTYNMLKLTRHLFCLDPKAEYADFYERALYNHILGSQNPKTSRVTYFVALKTGCERTYRDDFECCVGSGWENHAKYGDSIYFHDGNKALYVNLFIPSELNWAANGVKVTQLTKYPQEPKSELVFTCKKPVAFTLNVRRPWWATSGVQVAINSKKQAIKSTPGSYITITRKWKTGDKVVINEPMSLYTEGFKDNPNLRAVMYGPLVLCSEVDPKAQSPVLLSDAAKIPSVVKPVAGQPLTFTMPASALGSLGGRVSDMKLTPFYKQYEKPYIVYWDIFTPAKWAEQEKAYQAELDRQKEIEARTIDSVIPVMQQERDHNMQSENSSAGDMTNNGRVHKWRHAEGGWFSYDMKVDPTKPLDLVVTYWGKDAGNREFDILVDGVKLASVKLIGDKGNNLFDVTYPLSPELIAGKSKVTVKFQAQPGKAAGGFYGSKVVIRK